MPNAKRKRKRNTSSSTTSTRKHRNDSIEPILQKGLVSLRRTGKLVRSFHCQKLVRKLKQYKEQPTKDSNGRPNDESKIKQMEERLDTMKTLDLTKLVQICSQQLSLPPPTKNAPSSKSSSPSSNDSIHHSSTTTLTLEISSLENELVHQMLQHKQIQSCLSTLQNSLQSFQTSQERRLELQSIPKKQRKKDEKMQRREERYARECKHGNNGVMDYSGASGLFIASLAGSTKEDDDEGGDEYEEGEDHMYTGEYDAHREPVKNDIDEEPQRKRKNRKGSRARRAKALAIQAREEGRSWDKSMNWRSKKEYNKEEETTSKKAVTASEVADTGKDWKTDGTAHPSWLAKQRQKKEGIVAFSGTKITFD